MHGAVKACCCLIFLASLILLAGCRGDETFQQLSVTSLLAAPERISVAGGTYRLEATLWRDFMPGPGSPANGSPLLAVVRVTRTDTGSIPSTITIDRLWVIKDDQETWEPPLTDIRQGERQVEASAHDGPPWGPGIPADVVVRVINQDTNRTYLLQAPNCQITRTE